MTEPASAVVVGVGPGLGASLVRTFATAGLNVAAAARDPDKVSDHVGGGEGGEVRLYGCDSTDETAVETLFDQAEADLGPVAVAVYNAGAFVPASILETSSADFERCWRVGCLGGFHVGKAAATRMQPRGQGTIILTGATAALRGGGRFHNLAVGKFGLRALAQSMARELGPQGLHIAHVIIDGMIQSERHAHLGEERGPDSLLEPDEIAAEYLHLHNQHRSAWTLELDLRPWVEKF